MSGLPIPVIPGSVSSGREGDARRWSRVCLWIFLGLALPLLLGSSARAVERVSVSSAGGQANGASDSVAISGDGRFIAFESDANNLVAGDDNGRDDIFVHDQLTGATVRVSLSTGGDQANKDCLNPDISYDGRFVVFDSQSTTLISEDTNGVRDVFLRDRDPDRNGLFDEPGSVATVRISVDEAGLERNRASSFGRISGDGNYVAFEGNRSSGKSDIFVYDRTADVSVLVSTKADGSIPNGSSESPEISSDGRFVVFESISTDLVTPDLNLAYDVFLVDRDPDGDGSLEAPGATDLFLVSQNPSGSQANGASRGASLSDDGRHVAFWSAASDLDAADGNSKRDVFVRDMLLGTTQLVSRTSGAGVGGNADSSSPSISADGRFVAFQSAADDLVADDTNGKKDVFRFDRDSDRNQIYDELDGWAVNLESLSPDGNLANGDSGEFPKPQIAADGVYIAFSSAASDLVAGDTNNTRDAFLSLGEFCGDFFQGPGEECDEDNDVNGDGCDLNCRFSACGNGAVAPDETCDDGNQIDDDGCDSNCTLTSCGNGILTSGEVCDDANGTDGDGCDSNCTPTACGNEIQAGAEQCDLGDLNGGGNCCTDQCVLEDLDADGICDELDLLDLSGADAQSVRIRATRPDATRRDGLVRVKMDLDLDEQSFYSNASEFLAAGETNGFSLALYRGQEDPSADDVAVVSLSVDPADCSFGGAVGDLRRVSCRTVPAEPGGTFAKLKMKLGSQLSVLAVVRRADVSAPEGGPIHVVLNARDAEQVDFAGRLDQCVLRGSKRPTLGCR